MTTVIMGNLKSILNENYKMSELPVLLLTNIFQGNIL